MFLGRVKFGCQAHNLKVVGSNPTPATKSPLKTIECTALRDTSEGHSLLCMPSVWFDDDAFEQLSSYINSSKGAYAPNTERARLSDSRIFAEWCKDERKKIVALQARDDRGINSMSEIRAPVALRGEHLAFASRCGSCQSLQRQTGAPRLGAPSAEWNGFR